MQPDPFQRIASVRLHPVRRTAWHQTRSHNITMMTPLGDLPVNAIAARTRFIANTQLSPLRCQAHNQVLKGGTTVGDGAAPLRVGASGPGDGDRDGVLMDIKTHIGFIF